MVSAKDIILRPIASRRANAFIKRAHYSGKVTQNSQLHIGVFLHGRLEGALQFGPSLDKRKLIGLVDGTQWHQFIELNRLAFTDVLPRNSESRALSIAFKLIRKHAPQIKWVVSFADATQCGDGTIYRAAGFVLTGIKKNNNIALDGGGVGHHKMTYESNPISTGYTAVVGSGYNWDKFVEAKGWSITEGYQIRYIYFVDKSWQDRLTVPALPYSAIADAGAGMYKGVKTHAGD